MAQHRVKLNPRRFIVWSAIGVTAVLLISIVWLGIRGFLAYAELQTARNGANELLSEITENPEKAVKTITGIAEHTSQATALTSDPVWRTYELLPWAGANLEAVRIAAATLDKALSQTVLPLAAEADTLLGSLESENGVLNVSGLQELQPTAEAAAFAVAEAMSELDAVDTAQLLQPVAEGVAELTEVLAAVNATAQAVQTATVILPATLGAEGERDTLLLFLNNAELRPTVGIPGALALVRGDAGKISLATQASSANFPELEAPILDLGPQVRAITGERPALFIQNVTMVPNFSQAGELAQAMWSRQIGGKPTAVAAIDPVTLSYILEATGPLTLTSTGDVLSAENAVSLLLHEAYLRYEDPRMQDALFADAAATVFAAISAGNYDSLKLVEALMRGVQENRVKYWSSIPEEQALIAGTQLAGDLPLPGESVERINEFSMMLSDGTGAKMGYFLTSDAEITVGECIADSVAADGLPLQEVHVSFTLQSNAPADAAQLPKYITGGGVYGVPPGEIKTVGRLFAPLGYVLDRVSYEEVEEEPAESLLFQDRSLVQFVSTLQPGQQGVLTATYRASTASVQVTNWQQTPVFGQKVSINGGSGC